jgi:hypothetical protein
MVNFVSPWAYGVSRRPPTAQEVVAGYPCGPFDKQLLDWLMNALWAEVGHTISYAGIAGSNDDMQQLRKAIEQLIDTRVGPLYEILEGMASDSESGPDLSSYVTTDQARLRLPFFPDVLLASGKVGVTAPIGGQLLVAPNQNILHRGIYPFSTSNFTAAQRTFNTNASRFYHVRISLIPGAEAVQFKDLTDVTYNPLALSETDDFFDTTYDNMLIARAQTNGANISTITLLENRAQLFLEGEGSQGVNTIYEDNTIPSNVSHYLTHNCNWSRRPKVSLRAITDANINTGHVDEEISTGIWPISRYAYKTWSQYTMNPGNGCILGWQAEA